MKPDEITAEIKSIADQIIHKYDPLKIILFGSAARGEYDRVSDLDFLIIKEDVPVHGLARMRQLDDLIDRSRRTCWFTALMNSRSASSSVIHLLRQFSEKAGFFMADAQVIREWLKKADEDFEFAVSVIEESTFYAQICFHFHQAAEQYLKSVVVGWDLEFKKIHDLPVLLKSVLAKEPILQTLLGDCKLLNRLYIDTCYPVHWPTEYTKEETLRAKNAAEHIRDVVENSLKPLLSS